MDGVEPHVDPGQSILAATLGTIHGATMRAADRKAAVRRAIEISMTGLSSAGDAPHPGPSPIIELQEAISLVAVHAGVPHLDISGVKLHLRGMGAKGRALAAEVGNLSSRRNKAAHPSVGLPARLEVFLASAEVDLQAADSGSDASVSAVGSMSFDEMRDKFSSGVTTAAADASGGCRIDSARISCLEELMCSVMDRLVAVEHIEDRVRRLETVSERDALDTWMADAPEQVHPAPVPAGSLCGKVEKVDFVLPTAEGLFTSDDDESASAIYGGLYAVAEGVVVSDVLEAPAENIIQKIVEGTGDAVQ